MKPFVFQISVKPDTVGEIGLPKRPATQVQIDIAGLTSDYNCYRQKKNAPDLAALIISTDVLGELNKEGWPVKPGDLGENLTIANIDYGPISPDQKYSIGEVKLKYPTLVILVPIYMHFPMWAINGGLNSLKQL